MHAGKLKALPQHLQLSNLINTPASAGLFIFREIEIRDRVFIRVANEVFHLFIVNFKRTIGLC